MQQIFRHETDLRFRINRQGSQMTEAAITVPVIILAAMLLLRMFTFCLETLTADVKKHREAMDAQDSYSGAFIRTYTDTVEVRLLHGGLLSFNAGKRTEIRAYMINEDFLVRSGKVIDQ